MRWQERELDGIDAQYNHILVSWVCLNTKELTVGDITSALSQQLISPMLASQGIQVFGPREENGLVEATEVQDEVINSALEKEDIGKSYG